MRATLLDTGPVVAFVSRDDVHHEPTLLALRRSAATGRLLCTSWEVVAEAYTLVRTRGAPVPSPALAQAVLRWAWESAVTMLGTTESDHDRTAEILTKHIDQRLSYVDALLLALAERHAVDEVVTVDGAHFPVVRLDHAPEITVV
jgi:predicted nucleic acid-binding protein